VWPSWHFIFKWLTLRDLHFLRDTPHLLLLWGTRGLDDSGCDVWDDMDLGRVVYDDSFDAADPAAQAALLRACTEPPLNEALAVLPQQTQCLMLAFDTWLRDARNASLPLPRAQFNAWLPPFLEEQPSWLAALSVAATADGGFRIRHLVASFVIAIEPHAPASTRRTTYDAWQAEVRRLTDEAPPTAQHLVQTDDKLRWMTMAVQEMLVAAVRTVVPVSVIVGFCFVLIATRSLTIASLSSLSIVMTVVGWVGTAVASGMLNQGLGMVESVVLMVSVGLMLDPMSHICFAYSEAKLQGHTTREAQLRYALSTIGISVLAGSASTALSCAVLFFATIVLFSRFAALFCSLMALALIYALAFLSPLLLLLGPVGDVPAAGGGGRRLSFWRWPLPIGRRRATARRSLREEDSAAEAAAELEMQRGGMAVLPPSSSDS